MPPIHLLLSPECLTADGFALSGEQYHHLVRVRRVRVGEALQAALPDGRLLQATIADITPTVLHAQIQQVLAPSPMTRPLTLYQAVLKGEKMDLLVQKATELGVAQLVPILAHRSIPRWTAGQAQERAARWQRIADAAAGQAECRRSPQIALPCPLSACFDAPGLGVLLHERDGYSLRALADAHPAPDALRLFIGPEGGWTPDETAQLLATGIFPVHLGTRILRAETAAIAALTLAQFLWGDLG